MKNITGVILISLILFSGLLSCEVVNTDSYKGINLSGTVRADFTGTAPTNTVTVFLVDENNFSDDRIYLDTSTSWSVTNPDPAGSISMFVISSAIRYTTYQLVDIKPGTYYLCAEILPDTNVNYNSTFGPVEIIISESTGANVVF